MNLRMAIVAEDIDIAIKSFLKQMVIADVMK